MVVAAPDEQKVAWARDTHAVTAVGRAPVASSTWARASSPMIFWKSRTISGNGCGPATVPKM